MKHFKSEAHPRKEDEDEMVLRPKNRRNLISGIATASNQQSEGISQISQGITKVSQVIQTNSNTFEEGVAASKELLDEANRLREMVGQLKLKDNTTPYTQDDEINQNDEANQDDKISQEVFDVLDKMSKKKKILPMAKEDIHKYYSPKAPKKEEKSKTIDSSVQIVLSDCKFGKC